MDKIVQAIEKMSPASFKKVCEVVDARLKRDECKPTQGELQTYAESKARGVQMFRTRTDMPLDETVAIFKKAVN